MTDDTPQALAKELPEARMREVIEAAGRALKGKDGLALKGLDVDEEALETALDGAVRKALDVSPIKALVKAWKGTVEVGKLIGPNGPMDGKARQVAMAGHNLEVAHVPEIHVELGKVATLKKVPVPVKFVLKVQGLILSIKDRQITGIAGGHAQPEVSVSVEKVTLFKEKLRRISLPVDVTLYDEAQV